MNDLLLPALLAIIAVTAFVSFKGFDDMSFFRKYEFHIGSIRAGEQYRMLTSGFLHADVMHFAFNMLTLYFFGPRVIFGMGSFWFLVIYFGSLAFGSLFTLYFHKDEYSYRAIGASGAVTGVLYAAILLDPDMSLYLMFIPIPIPGYIFGILYLFYSIYGMRTRTDNIGHTAHFGGAVGGYVLTLAREPYIISSHLPIVLLLAVPIAVLFVLAKSGKL